MFLSSTAILSIMLIISCSKNSKDVSAGESKSPVSIKTSPSTAARPSGSDASVAIQLHRSNGKKRHGEWEGRDCNCVYCFGLCSGKILANSDNPQQMNAIFKNIANGTATIYFLTQPDDDVLVAPIFYVDNNVVLTATNNDNITVFAGQYAYQNTPGQIQYQGRSYSYFGKTVVSCQ